MSQLHSLTPLAFSFMHKCLGDRWGRVHRAHPGINELTHEAWDAIQAASSLWLSFWLLSTLSPSPEMGFACLLSLVVIRYPRLAKSQISTWTLKAPCSMHQGSAPWPSFQPPGRGLLPLLELEPLDPKRQRPGFGITPTTSDYQSWLHLVPTFSTHQQTCCGIGDCDLPN